MSFIVAIAGHGDMSVSNAYGSNIFDILIAVGFPLFLEAVIYNKEVAIGGTIQKSVTILFILVGVQIFFYTIFRLKLNKWVAVCYIFLYVCFVIYVFINDYTDYIPN